MVTGRFPEQKQPSQQFRSYSQTYLTFKKQLVECGKIFINSQTNTSPRRRKRVQWHRNDTKTTRNQKCLCCHSVQDPCRIVFENCRFSWNRSSWRSGLKICLFSEKFPIFIVWHQRRNEGGTIPRAPNYCGGAKSHNNVIALFQNSIFASERPQVRTWGRQTCFLPQAPSTLVTPLHITI